MYNREYTPEKITELKPNEIFVFGILDDHNAHQSHNPEGNFKPFADEFVGY